MTDNSWSARREAAQALMDILYDKGYSSIVLNRRLRNLPPEADRKDRAFISSLVYTTISELYYIDAVINTYSKTAVGKMKPWVAVVLRMTVCQLLFFDTVPDSAAVHEGVELVKRSRLRGLQGFVNGVLRGILRGAKKPALPDAEESPLAYASILHSIPAWILKIWLDAYGYSKMMELAEVSHGPKRLCLRCNTLKISPEEFLVMLRDKVGAENVRPGDYLPECAYIRDGGDMAAWPEFKQGLFIVQDESSALAGRALGAKPGDRVLDMCAAPGGKSTHIAQLMQNTGAIISRDIHEHKVKLIAENAARLGVSIIQPQFRDGVAWEPEEEGSYDEVLLDAPCSGLGILRSKPDIKLNREPDHIGELVKLQTALLEAASHLVRPGGALVYSTCTINPAENEDTVQLFLEKHQDFFIENFEKDLPRKLECDTIKDGYAVLMPVKAGMDGFFIAKFRRRALDEPGTTGPAQSPAKGVGSSVYGAGATGIPGPADLSMAAPEGCRLLSGDDGPAGGTPPKIGVVDSDFPNAAGAETEIDER